MRASNEEPDILNNKIKLINANYVPDNFVTSLNETYEWFKKEENLKKYTNIKNYNI